MLVFERKCGEGILIETSKRDYFAQVLDVQHSSVELEVESRGYVENIILRLGEANVPIAEEDKGVKMTLLKVRGNRVKLGFQSNQTSKVWRSELFLSIEDKIKPLYHNLVKRRYLASNVKSMKKRTSSDL